VKAHLSHLGTENLTQFIDAPLEKKLGSVLLVLLQKAVYT
jgi:hypothetical protein